MPDQVWTYAQLTAALQGRLASDLKLSYFDNDVDPGKSGVFSDFNIADDPVTMNPLTFDLLTGDWSYATDTDGAVASQPSISQVVNGPIDLYGYFVYTLANALVFYQRFDASDPVSLPSGANATILTPACHENSP